MDLRDVELPERQPPRDARAAAEVPRSSLGSRRVRGRSRLRRAAAAALAPDRRGAVLARTALRPVHARHRADRAARRDDRHRLVLRARPVVGTPPRSARARASARGESRPPRDPAQATRPPYSPFGIGYVFGTQDADEMFLAYTLPCVWDGAGARPRHHRLPRARRHVRAAGRRRAPVRVRPRARVDAHDLARRGRRARPGAVGGGGAREPPRRARAGHRLLPLGMGRRGSGVRRGPVARGWRSVGSAASCRLVAHRTRSNG